MNKKALTDKRKRNIIAGLRSAARDRTETSALMLSTKAEWLERLWFPKPSMRRKPLRFTKIAVEE